MVGVAPISRGINGACYELQSRPQQQEKAGFGSPRVVYDIVCAISRLHAWRSVCLLRAVLGLLKKHRNPLRGDQLRAVKLGPQGKL